MVFSSTILKKTDWMAKHLGEKASCAGTNCFLTKNGSDRINKQVGLLVFSSIAKVGSE